MARKKMAVGGVQSILNRRRNYLFDENDGIVEFDNSPEPTTVSEEVEPTSTPTRTRRTVSRRTNKTNSNENKSGNIINIGAKRFSTAFKQARVAGLDKFRWNGKVYGTKLANEVGKTTKEKARNAAKPASQKPKAARQDTNRVTTTRTNSQNNRQPNTTSNNTNNSVASNRQNLGPIRNANNNLGLRSNNGLDFAGNFNRYQQTSQMIDRNIADRRRNNPNMYEARMAARAAGRKQFNWQGNTYSTYGANSNQAGTYGRRRK